MSTSAQEIYSRVVRILPPSERLRLATLILNELVDQDSSGIDQGDDWSEQDQIDITNFSLQYASIAFPEDEEIEQ